METTPKLAIHACQISAKDLWTRLTSSSTVDLDKPKVCLVAKSEYCQTDDTHYFVEKEWICMTVKHDANFT